MWKYFNLKNHFEPLPEIAANYTETVAGKALDATMGKDLNERLEPVEGITGIDCGEITAEEPEEPEESEGE